MNLIFFLRTYVVLEAVIVDTSKCIVVGVTVRLGKARYLNRVRGTEPQRRLVFRLRTSVLDVDFSKTLVFSIYSGKW